MITNIKEIATESPVEEVWKNLRLFLHVDSVADRIHELHKNEKPRKSDVDKQAKQLAYCIKQAEEYFHASSQVDLPTRPNLLYYGAVSLSRALVLLRQSGEHSFDSLRKSGKHNHHGLILEKTFKSMKPDRPGIFFNAIQCAINIHPKPPCIPWGHFPIFYESLVPPVFLSAFEISSTGYINAAHQSINLHNGVEKQSLHQLLPPFRFNVLDLIKTLPDMDELLTQFGMQSDLRKVWRDVVADVQAPKDANPKERRVMNAYYESNALSASDKSRLFTVYLQRHHGVAFFGEPPASLLFKRRVVIPNGWTYLPDIVSSIAEEKYYIVYPDAYIIEPASLFILLFCLGMLARYHPDLWMRAIEHVEIAELADSLLNVCYRKFPHLLLDQLTFTHHVFRVT